MHVGPPFSDVTFLHQIHKFTKRKMTRICANDHTAFHEIGENDHATIQVASATKPYGHRVKPFWYIGL